MGYWIAVACSTENHDNCYYIYDSITSLPVRILKEGNDENEKRINKINNNASNEEINGIDQSGIDGNNQIEEEEIEIENDDIDMPIFMDWNPFGTTLIIATCQRVMEWQPSINKIMTFYRLEEMEINGIVDNKDFNENKIKSPILKCWYHPKKENLLIILRKREIVLSVKDENIEIRKLFPRDCEMVDGDIAMMDERNHGEVLMGFFISSSEIIAMNLDDFKIVSRHYFSYPACKIVASKTIKDGSFLVEHRRFIISYSFVDALPNNAIMNDLKKQENDHGNNNDICNQSNNDMQDIINDANDIQIVQGGKIDANNANKKWKELKMQAKYLDSVNRPIWSNFGYTNKKELIYASAEGHLYFWNYYTGSLASIIDKLGGYTFLNCQWHPKLPIFIFTDNSPIIIEEQVKRGEIGREGNKRVSINGSKKITIKKMLPTMEQKWTALIPGVEEIESNIIYNEKENDFDDNDNDHMNTSIKENEIEEEISKENEIEGKEIINVIISSDNRRNMYTNQKWSDFKLLYCN